MENYKKKYEQAFEKAKEVYNHKDATDSGKLILESMFPELCESEDERIRKEIIEFVKSRGGFKQEYIAWLEKQGEQKSAWSEEDEIGLGNAMWAIEQARTIAKDVNDMGNLWSAEWWLKSLKERMKGE